MTTPLVEIRDLVKHFPVTGGVLLREVAKVHAVDGVSLAIEPGETLAGAALRELQTCFYARPGPTNLRR